MKFFAEVIVLQHDSVAPDYQQLHDLLAEAGFVQRHLDGTRTSLSSSGTYTREERILGAAEVEHDLRFVLENFPHPCSYHLHRATEVKHYEPEAVLEHGPAFTSSGIASPASSYLQ